MIRRDAACELGGDLAGDRADAEPMAGKTGGHDHVVQAVGLVENGQGIRREIERTGPHAFKLQSGKGREHAGNLLDGLANGTDARADRRAPRLKDDLAWPVLGAAGHPKASRDLLTRGHVRIGDARTGVSSG